jgi:hypothetical protein
MAERDDDLFALLHKRCVKIARQDVASPCWFLRRVHTLPGKPRRDRRVRMRVPTEHAGANRPVNVHKALWAALHPHGPPPPHRILMCCEHAELNGDDESGGGNDDGASESSSIVPPLPSSSSSSLCGEEEDSAVAAAEQDAEPAAYVLSLRCVNPAHIDWQTPSRVRKRSARAVQ